MDQSLSMNAQPDEAAGRVPDSPRWRSRSRLITLACVVAVVLGAVGYTRWWTQPTAFGPVGNGFGFTQTSDAVHPVTIDLVQRSVHATSETVSLRRVRPRVVTNTAGARVTFAVCRRQDPFMAADGKASKVCESVANAVDRDVLLTGEGTTTITMTVTPQHAGRVVIEGVEIEYSRGFGHLWQRGTEATGPVVRVRVRN